MQVSRSLVISALLFSSILTACGKSGSSRNSNNSAAANYNGSQFDPQFALNGMGQWVEIGGENYFMPDNSQLTTDDGIDWAPYQRGYWSYDQDLSWTWVSHDPFGWATDHYGVWRHHNRYGWIWLPFKNRRYQPHAVTWFDEGDYIGWYPYFPDYAAGYAYGANYGFDDGFWVGGQIQGININVNLIMGFTIVPRSRVTEVNIRTVILRDRQQIFNLARLAHAPERLQFGRVGRYPGGNRAQAYDFVQKFASRQAPIGRAHEVRSRGGARIMQPPQGRGADYQQSKPIDRPNLNRAKNNSPQSTNNTQPGSNRQSRLEMKTQVLQKRPQEDKQNPSSNNENTQQPNRPATPANPFRRFNPEQQGQANAQPNRNQLKRDNVEKKTEPNKPDNKPQETGKGARRLPPTKNVWAKDSPATEPGS